MIGKIYGTGSYIPSKVVTNHDLEKVVETNDEWIRERTGIGTRHIAERESTVSMATESAKRAIEMAGIQPEEIDLILVSTISPNTILPCVACEVQKEVGAVHATCFDLNAACTGFLYAYNTAQAYITAEIYKTVLIIGSEALSSIVDWKDRNTCILFGDGAGAVILKAEEQGIFCPYTRSDGEKGQALTCLPGGTIQMNGQLIFRFAVKQVPLCIQELLQEQNISLKEIDYFILHQANKRIVEAVAKRLGVTIEKFPMNLQKYGNTSSASIPILLDELNRQGQLKRGMKIVLAGFGAGLSWGASLIEW